MDHAQVNMLTDLQSRIDEVIPSSFFSIFTLLLHYFHLPLCCSPLLHFSNFISSLRPSARMLRRATLLLSSCPQEGMRHPLVIRLYISNLLHLFYILHFPLSSPKDSAFFSSKMKDMLKRDIEASPFKV